MEHSPLLRRVIGALERLEIPYFITGSIASTAYGEPRFTHDIDIVVRLGPGDVDPLCEHFPEKEYYVSREAARDAVSRHGQFNIIHAESGHKVDLIVADESPFNESRFERARTLAYGDLVPSFSSPEDVVIKKLDTYRESGSDRHIRDAASVLRVWTPIDYRYIEHWVTRLGLRDEWRLLKEAVG